MPCLVGPLFGREALLWFVNVTSFGTVFAYLHVGLPTLKRFREIALNNNRSNRYVKNSGASINCRISDFPRLILYQLWLYYRFTAFIAVVAYSLLGLALYMIRKSGVRK